MLGPSSIVFACVSLLVHLSFALAATIVTRDAPLAPAVVIFNALAKGGVSPRCTIACRAVESSYVNAINIPQLCTTLVESQARYCFGCQVTARVEPLAFFQTALNNFASSCSAARIALKTADIDQNVATDPGSDNDSGPAVTPQAPDAAPASSNSTDGADGGDHDKDKDNGGMQIWPRLEMLGVALMTLALVCVVGL